MSEIASFRARLSHLTEYLDDPTITEIAINRPGEVWLGEQGKRFMRRIEIPSLTYHLLESLADVSASHSSQETSREQPLLASTIPINLEDGIDDAERGGYRVQVVRPPAVADNTIAICIRKPILLEFDLKESSEAGVSNSETAKLDENKYSKNRWPNFYRRGRWEEFWQGA